MRMKGDILRTVPCRLNISKPSVSVINLENSNCPNRQTRNELGQHCQTNIFIRYADRTSVTISELKQYISVTLIGLTSWGCLWFYLESLVLPGGYVFTMSFLVVVGYVFGHTLERFTNISPIVGMTLVGALYRNFLNDSMFSNPMADAIDYHLRRIYPCIILTRGSLIWNWDYIRLDALRVFSMATLPWIVEWLSIASITHVALNFSWYWGLHLGSILASLSPAVVIPKVLSFNSKGLGSKNLASLIANSGGLDTAFTEGMFGVINTAIFVQTSTEYKIIKIVLTIFIGVAIGVLWGVLLDYIPDHTDPYAATTKSLLIFTGTLALSYVCPYFGWGGISGVATMVCGGTVAHRWSKRGWVINANPVSEVYKIAWRVFEPMLFTLSGYYLDVSLIDPIPPNHPVSLINMTHFGLIICCIIVPLLLRMFAAFLIAATKSTITYKECIFVSVANMPKAIVEAVLVRAATDSLWTDGSATNEDKLIARLHSTIIVIAILLGSTLGSALTSLLGPILLNRHQP